MRQVVTGFFAYHAVPTNIWSLGTFRFRITDLWRRSLRRRSQKDGTTWRRITKLANDFLPRGPASFIRGPKSASPSGTRGGSRVPEWGPLGSVRGRSVMSVPTAIDRGRPALGRAGRDLCQRKHPAEILARTAPPTVAARTRIVSAAGIRLNHRKSARPFNGIFCADISEFESHMPSHAVGSLWRVYPVHGLCEQRRSP